MQRDQGWALLALVAILFVGIAASASAEHYVSTCALRATTDLCPRPLVFNLGVEVAPQKLSRHEIRPVALTIRGKTHNGDRIQPSVLRELAVDFDRNLALNATGLSTCRLRLLSTRNVRAARNVCRDAIVGEGLAHLAIEPAEDSASIPAVLTLFNGGISAGRGRMLFVHSFIASPTPAALVTTVAIQKNGGSGLHTISRIPVIAGGSGSVLDFSVRIKRLFTYKRTTKGYLEARCPHGRLDVDVPKVLFKNERQVPGVAATTVLKGGLAVPCTPELT